MKKNKMVLFTTKPNKIRFCIRNQYSDYFNDFDLIRIGKTLHMERIEYKLGLLGLQIILMYFKDKKPCCF